jgi:hypothetical protein
VMLLDVHAGDRRRMAPYGQAFAQFQ